MISPTLDLVQPASAIFGDGASAIVVGEGASDAGLIAHVATADGSMHGAVTFEHADGPNTHWYEAGEGFHPSSGDREATRKLTSRLLHLGVDTMRACFDRTRTSARRDRCARNDSADGVVSHSARGSAGDSVSSRSHYLRPHRPHRRCGGSSRIYSRFESAASCTKTLAALYAHGAGVNRTAALIRWG